MTLDDIHCSICDHYRYEKVTPQGRYSYCYQHHPAFPHAEKCSQFTIVSDAQYTSFKKNDDDPE